MTPYSKGRRNTVSACIASLFFLLAGLVFIPRLGIESDETLFAAGIYPPRSDIFAIRIGHSRIPIMMMSYLGALKSWVYHPILSVFGTGQLTLRIPGLLAATLSIWLFFLAVRRVAGERAALIGCGILAVDSTYLLTSCFDWGPVALQHLLAAGGTLLVIRFFQERRHWPLFGGFLLFGMLLWDKALSLWMLNGMGLAAMVTFPRQIFAAITPRRVAIAVLGFALGALPLWIYNYRQDWMTFRGNFHRETVSIADKALFLERAAAGGGLFGWMSGEAGQTPAPHQPRAGLETVSAEISTLAGHPRHDCLIYAFVLAILLIPLLRGAALRIAIFSLIALIVAWLQMAITANTGLALHHTILLWPLPQLTIAVSLASASRHLGRAGIPAVGAVLAVVMVSGALLINEYYQQMVRYGGGAAWNSAIYPLAEYLVYVPGRVPGTRIVCLDWGIMEPLQFLDRGQLPLEWGDDALSNPELTAEDRRRLEQTISQTGNLYVAHTSGFAVFPGRTAKLVGLAEESGLHQEVLQTFSDGFGRDVLQVYRFAH